MQAEDRRRWQERLERTDWSQFKTAYGPADKVPALLTRLRFGSSGDALSAANDLWAGLCHQHAYVSSAALPALPFIIDVLSAQRSGALAEELLDILLGFARCTGPAYGEPPEWAVQLRRETKRAAELLAWWAEKGSDAERELATWALEALSE